MTLNLFLIQLFDLAEIKISEKTSMASMFLEKEQVSRLMRSKLSRYRNKILDYKTKL
jgi:hypothetical protein